MSEQTRFHPSVLISCSGCGEATSAEQLGQDADRPFRCDRCKARNSETVARLAAQGIVEVVNVEATRQSENIGEGGASNPRKRERGNQPAQQQSS